MSEKINHPSHYGAGQTEAINVIEEHELNFNLGNVIKYVLRAGKKPNEPVMDDLKKAKWYLDREINRHYLSEAKDNPTNAAFFYYDKVKVIKTVNYSKEVAEQTGLDNDHFFYRKVGVVEGVRKDGKVKVEFLDFNSGEKMYGIFEASQLEKVD